VPGWQFCVRDTTANELPLRALFLDYGAGYTFLRGLIEVCPAITCYSKCGTPSTNLYGSHAPVPYTPTCLWHTASDMACGGIRLPVASHAGPVAAANSLQHRELTSPHIR